MRVLLILGAAGSLAGPGGHQLVDDLRHRSGVGGAGGGAGGAAEAAVAAPSAGEIEVDDGNMLALDVAPDVELGPGEERVHAHVFARGEVRPVLIPELRRLTDDIPLGSFTALAEDALLGPRAFLVPANADDDGLELVLLDHLLQRLRLERRTADQPASPVVHPLGERGRVLSDDQLEAQLAGEAIAILDHLGNLVARVDVDQRVRDVPEQRLARQPEQDRRVLPHRPQHGQPGDLGPGLAQDVQALVFERLEVVQRIAPLRDHPRGPQAYTASRSPSTYAGPYQF